MQPVIELFGKTISVYGVFYILGIGFAALSAVILAKGKMPAYEVVYSAVYSVIGGILGAKLLFVAVSIPQILEKEIPLWAVLRGGFVFYGGVIGGAVGLLAYCRQFKIPFFRLADLYSVCLPLGHTIGRFGCYFAGCCYGMEYDGPFSVTYHTTLGDTPLGVPLLPIQLIEAVALIALFLLLMVRYCKGDYEIPGRLVGLYATAYGVLRFLLEFFRGDLVRGVFSGLFTSQWISLGLFAIGVWLLLKGKRFGKEL